MKIISIITFFLGCSSLAFSQVIIGDAVGTATNKTSVLVEFSKENKGLVLPYVRTLPTPAKGLVEGTILLDASSTGASRIKVYDGNTTAGTQGWTDLSGRDGNTTSQLANQPTLAEDTNSKAIIGANSSSAAGVLVLESTTKAMVLPQVADVNDIPKPAPGMLVYVNKAGAKRLAVYNGTVWTFWKP